MRRAGRPGQNRRARTVSPRPATSQQRRGRSRRPVQGRCESDGEPWFANSSVVLWVQCLHHYGLRVDTCDLLLNAEFHEEDAVLAELEELAAELKECDPAAFAGYQGFIWPEFLARWLW
ncbi:SUKH-4 family immunity protein [Streptomyces sp. PKU-EA00015]|nr:SUKH-4 family immunity protein [Streptomyces sp. PKU-EA00015]